MAATPFQYLLGMADVLSREPLNPDEVLQFGIILNGANAAFFTMTVSERVG